MKEEFLKFQVPKEAMNELRGGVVAACKCSNSNEIFILAGDTMVDVGDDADQWCGDNGFKCVKA
ncbi:hypothetical protein [Bacteroides fluxus]|uniref:Uncharacterized protein n=1 Tax=Bacteroides fluxus YIT 12057 TaxID=763034 RepID=F3PW58_9BACE|nr:hypothetical protein [Bacteroides fluxus]EGF52636.1 hypothetical protein HMPREF9446_02991 [Bacteroides fluxus YIT 12057]